MTTPGGPGSINPNARFGITGDNSHGDTVADLQQRLQAAIEGRLKADIKASQGWKGASDAAFGGLMLRGTPGQPVSISLAIIASLAARLLGINPQTWLISADPHENIERILAELKRSRSSMTSSNSSPASRTATNPTSAHGPSASAMPCRASTCRTPDPFSPQSARPPDRSSRASSPSHG